MAEDMAKALFGSALRAKAVGWLFSHPDEKFYVNQIARATGLPASNLSIELRKLAAAGFLETDTLGGLRQYRANHECPIFGELKSIAVKTAGLAGVLREALSRLDGIDAAFIYGSIARGDAGAESDVDIMVIGRPGFADVIAALEGASERLGRDVNPRVYEADEFRHKAAEGGGFLTEVLVGPKIFLAGDAAALKRVLD
jgi:predicted nucleotidyltransferase